jgi:hypothetical protein
MVTSIEPIKQGYYLLRRLAVSVVVPGQGERLPRRRDVMARDAGEEKADAARTRRRTNGMLFLTA